MNKNYINHLCIATLAGTLFACGGGGSTPAAGGFSAAITSNGSSSGNGGNNNTSGGGNNNTSGGGTKATNLVNGNFEVKGFNFNGDETGFTVPDDKGFGTAFNALYHTINLKDNFRGRPLDSQLTGNVTLNGYIAFSSTGNDNVILETNTDGGLNETIRGASSLTFNFANKNSEITGTATNFGLYTFSDSSGAAFCEPATCSYTKLSNPIGGELTITGNLNTDANNNANVPMSLTLRGVLKHNVSEQNAVTYEFGEPSLAKETNITGGISGRPSLYGQATGTTKILSQRDFDDIAQRAQTINVRGEWRQ